MSLPRTAPTLFSLFLIGSSLAVGASGHHGHHGHSHHQDPSRAEIQTLKLTDNIYMLIGAGGNIGVCTGPEGTFMIDDQFAQLSAKIKDAIKKITDKPVRFVINTHWHFDHTGGNENFGKDGAVIVAHKNVRKRMAKGQFMKDFENDIPPAPAVALPVITFLDALQFHINGEEIRVFHVEHSHTDGDAMIHFPDSNVLHMGDCFFNGFYPYFDIGSGGRIDGMIAVGEQTLDLVDDETKIIPGHGPLATKADLARFVEMLAEVRDLVAAPVDAGESLQQVLASNPLAPFDKPWGQFFLSTERFTTLLYNDLVRSKK